MSSRNVIVYEEDVATFINLLRRSIAEDQSEIKRLNMLATAYSDRSTGESASNQLAAVRARQALANDLLFQIESS